MLQMQAIICSMCGNRRERAAAGPLGSICIECFPMLRPSPGIGDAACIMCGKKSNSVWLLTTKPARAYICEGCSDLVADLFGLERLSRRPSRE